jgi:hypothetical protein
MEPGQKRRRRELSVETPLEPAGTGGSPLAYRQEREPHGRERYPPADHYDEAEQERDAHREELEARDRQVAHLSDRMETMERKLGAFLLLGQINTLRAVRKGVRAQLDQLDRTLRRLHLQLAGLEEPGQGLGPPAPGYAGGHGYYPQSPFDDDEDEDEDEQEDEGEVSHQQQQRHQLAAEPHDDLN